MAAITKIAVSVPVVLAITSKKSAYLFAVKPPCRSSIIMPNTDENKKLKKNAFVLFSLNL